MKKSLIYLGVLACFSICFCFIANAGDTAEKRPKSVVITYNPKQISKIVPLKTVNYSTIESICKPLLSKTGTMGYLQGRNSVILFDYQKNVDKITGLIGKIDMPAVNIRIDVDFIGNSNRKQDKLYGKIGYKKYPTKNNQIIIKNGKIVKPNRITFDIGKGRQRRSRNTSQFIVTKSGYPARLWVGKRIVDPSWLRYRKLQPTWVIVGPGGGTVVVPGSDNDIVWTDVGSALYVLPKYLGNGKIDVEVYPVVSYLVDEPDDRPRRGKKGKRRKRRKHQSVKVEDVSTHLTLQSGQRVSMGGAISSNRNFYTNLFGPDFINRDDSNSILDMYITATVIDPAGRPRKSNIPYTSRDSSPIKMDDIPAREDPSRLFRHR